MNFERIYQRLHHALHKLRGDAPFPLLHQKNNIQGGRYQLIRRLTIKHVLCGGLVVLTVFLSVFICCVWTARHRIFCISSINYSDKDIL